MFGILTVLALTLLEREWRRGQGRDATRRMTMVAAPAAALTLAVVCLLLTASRMALLSTLIAVSALTLWVMLAGPKGRNSLAPGITLAITVAGILIVGGNDLLWSRLAQDDAMLDDRLLLFATHWEAFRISPLTGWGLGSFDVVNLHIMSSETAPSLWSIRAAHNVYIQWLEEAGLLGALPMFLLAAWLVLDAARRARQQGSGQSLLIGLVCANLVVLVHGTMDFALQVPSISAFWALLLGLQFGFGRSSSR